MSTFDDAVLGQMKLAKETNKTRKRVRTPESERGERYLDNVTGGIGGAALGGIGGAALGGAAGMGLNALLEALARRSGAVVPSTAAARAALEGATARRILAGANVGLGLGTIGGALGGAAISNRAHDNLDEISSNTAKGALGSLGLASLANAGLAGYFGHGSVPRNMAHGFYNALGSQVLPTRMMFAGGAAGGALGSGILKAMGPDMLDPKYVVEEPEKTAAFRSLRSRLQKVAKFDGAGAPDYLHREAIPYDTRKQHYQEYLNEKAVESKEPMGAAIGRGALKGGLVGAIPGALLGLGASGTGTGALVGAGVGGLGGAGLGALMNWARVHGDRDEINEALRLHKDPAAVDRALVKRIADEIAWREGEEDDYRDEMLMHARRQSYRDEGDRYGRRY